MNVFVAFYRCSCLTRGLQDHHMFSVAVLWEPRISKKSTFHELRITVSFQLCDNDFST